MIKSIETKHGTIVIREANLTDVDQYRTLRLFALQESPLAFGQDYETSLNNSPEIWQARASHAEPQAIVNDPTANVIEVMRPMCKSCQGFMSKEAQFQGRPITVKDPEVTRTFMPDGTVKVSPNTVIKK